MIKLQCLTFPKWIQQTSNLTNLPKPNFKGIVSYVNISRVFNYDVFQRFGDLKMRFLHNEYFLSKHTMYYVFCVSEVYNRIVMYLFCDAKFCQSEYNKRANVQTSLIPILKKSSNLYLFLERFIMLIFSVLVTWKRDFCTTINYA